jgi:hypothetical protein
MFQGLLIFEVDVVRPMGYTFLKESSLDGGLGEEGLLTSVLQ